MSIVSCLVLVIAWACRAGAIHTPFTFQSRKMASHAWKVVQRHVPLIKFRKGGPPAQRSTAGEAASGPSAPAARRSSGPAIEPYQLPKRYQRRPLDQYEIDYINRGGPD